MPFQPSIKNGFGVQSQLTPVTSVVAGANAVNSNVGCGIAVAAWQATARMSTLRWRVDLAPDVPGGSASVPVRWRVLVFRAQSLPGDVSGLQAQAYPAGSHPELPLVQGSAAPVEILHDEFLDFSQGDPGLNELASREWNDGGPSASGGNFLCALIVPIIDANMDQTVIGAANANIYIEAHGVVLQDTAGQENARSLARFADGARLVPSP